MLTKKEVHIRAAKCRELMNFGPYKEIIIEEMNELIEDTKESIVDSLVNGLTEKAIIDANIINGIRRVLNTPIEAIEESNNLNENS